MTLSPSDVLGPDGLCVRGLPEFRARAGQLHMATEVEELIRDGGMLAVEAPTGTGKSLAYLVPAVLASIAEGRRVVIATHTLALQDQLVTRDLPALATLLPMPFRTVRAIGRGNYLGLRRFGGAREGVLDLFDSGPEEDLRRIAERVEEGSFDGRRESLGFQVADDVWREVQSDGNNCLAKRCPTYSECFHWKARAELEGAEVIVANHALLLTDVMTRREGRPILPDFDVLVVDEAHMLEGVARDLLGVEFSEAGVLRLLGRLAGRGRVRGLFARAGLDPACRERAGRAFDALKQQFVVLRQRLARGDESTVRFRAADAVPDIASAPLLELAAAMEEVIEDVPEQQRAELKAAASELKRRGAAAAAILGAADHEHVHFAEGLNLASGARLVSAPLDIATTLRDELFGRVKSVLLTSATLGSGSGKLGHFLKRNGAAGARELVLQSPFDLARQAKLIFVKGLPEPDDRQFTPEAVVQCQRAIEASGGGAFLLFTSKAMLQAFLKPLKPWLEGRGILVLDQGGKLARPEMLEAFRRDGNAVLFGLESFWHGVDVPGAALRLVIIPRLPFPVPTEPVMEALSEKCRAEGGNDFQELFLPSALIRFRQGFGRLLRSESDEGLVICLDARVHSKNYGVRFRRCVEGVSVEIRDANARG